MQIFADNSIWRKYLKEIFEEGILKILKGFTDRSIERQEEALCPLYYTGARRKSTSLALQMKIIVFIKNATKVYDMMSKLKGQNVQCYKLMILY